MLQIIHFWKALDLAKKKCELPQTKKTISQNRVKTSLKEYPMFFGENKNILKTNFLIINTLKLNPTTLTVIHLEWKETERWYFKLWII